MKMKNIISIRTRAIIAEYTSIICGILSVVLMVGAAGQGDYYAEIGEAVPGNSDMKMLAVASVFLGITIISQIYLRGLDIDCIFDLSLIPVYADSDICNKADKNKYFENQLEKCLDQFYNGEYGFLSIGDMRSNRKAMESGKGVVIGQYNTAYGTVIIATNSKRTRTEIMFMEHYYEYAM